MKFAYGLPALLLGTTLLAGSAFAQQQNTSSAPQPHVHWNHSGQGANANAPNTPPPNTPAPQRGHGHGNFAPNANFAGPRGPNNPAHRQMRWNHAMNFHDRNVAHFSAQDRSTWTQGHWRHERHNGRNGWWWNAGGAWFFYDQPVYPYPGYASEDYSLDDSGYDAGPNPYDDQSGYTWYYCNNPAGYYPYIQSCRGPWEPVDPYTQQGYDQGPQQGGPDAYDDNDDRGGPPPQGQYQAQPNGPQQGYDGDNDDGDDSDQGPPQGYNGDDRGPPPGYGDQGPPPR